MLLNTVNNTAGLVSNNQAFSNLYVNGHSIKGSMQGTFTFESEELMEILWPMKKPTPDTLKELDTLLAENENTSSAKDE